MSYVSKNENVYIGYQNKNSGSGINFNNLEAALPKVHCRHTQQSWQHVATYASATENDEAVKV